MTDTRPPKPAPFIAVNLTPAMSGYFATFYDFSWMEGGTNIHGEAYEGQWFPEPYETGFGRYATWQEANAEGERWAEAEGVAFHPATAERAARAEAHAARSRQRMGRFKELVEGGMDRKSAMAQAKAELPDLPPVEA